MHQITDKQMKIVQYICTFTDQFGFQPSYRQVADFLDYKSLGYIAYTIRVMKKRGLVLATGPRAVSFAGDWRGYVMSARDPEPAVSAASEDAADVPDAQYPW